jgi:hypothetical protein
MCSPSLIVPAERIKVDNHFEWACEIIDGAGRRRRLVMRSGARLRRELRYFGVPFEVAETQARRESANDSPTRSR